MTTSFWGASAIGVAIGLNATSRPSGAKIGGPRLVVTALRPVGVVAEPPFTGRFQIFPSVASIIDPSGKMPGNELVVLDGAFSDVPPGVSSYDEAMLLLSPCCTTRREPYAATE